MTAISHNRRVAVFTGNRAEYGLLNPVLRAIRDHPALKLNLIVSGAHLEKDFGATLAEIQNDGFTIDVEVKIDNKDDSLIGTAFAIGTGVVSMAEALAKIRPDLLVVYADRFEGFAAIIAGTQMGIPTVHLEGGDVTEGGALDDSVRHAMTKLAHIHLTTNEQASTRIRAMGEEEWRVHTVGFPGIDLITEGHLASESELSEQFGITSNRPVVLFTQHSLATQSDAAAQQVRPSLNAIRRLAGEDVICIVTYPNNDAGGRRIISELEVLEKEERPNVLVRKTLGRYNYYGLLALAKNADYRIACAGNSSSGIKETPAFGCPTVNIGSRQQGRLRSTNSIDVDYDADRIYSALRRCLYDEEFRRMCNECKNPYGTGDAGVKISKIIASLDLGEDIIRKRMMICGEEKNGWFR